MDLEKQAKICPSAKTTSSSNSIDKPAQVSLFDAVRKWTDAEGVDAFDIELDGNCLTPEQIQEIAHSEPYQDRLLAFNERLDLNAHTMRTGAMNLLPLSGLGIADMAGLAVGSTRSRMTQLGHRLPSFGWIGPSLDQASNDLNVGLISDG